MNILKFFFRLASYYLLPFFLILALFFEWFTYYEFVISGILAFFLLIITLFIKPLAVLTDFVFLKRFLFFRREIGVAIFWLALFHAFGLSILSGFFDINVYLNFQSFYFWGFVSLFMIFILGITSNNISMRFLKQYWKTVQKLSYFALFAVFIHRSIITNEWFIMLLIIFSFLFLKILEWRKNKKRISSF